jgi:gamma-glutamyl hercynylcysteine S-oxide synthase
MNKRTSAIRVVTHRSVAYLFILGVVIIAFLFCAAYFLFESLPYKTKLIGVISVALVYILTLVAWGRRKFSKEFSSHEPHAAREEILNCEPNETRPISATDKPVDPNDIDALVEQMLAQNRFALLLRPQIVGNLSQSNFGRALTALGECMALVPDGDVQLDDGDSARVVTVERFFLDRCLVTNRQYYEFVAAGGYRQPALWDESILPGVLEFNDRSGRPGPKYWQNGCYPMGEEKHPVAGVNWYEAAAYARWVGKRLPSDAEWIKAGSWPVRISSTTQVQRKYPWGDMMDRSRANLWGSGPGRTVPVDQYPSGISAGGVHQLIGNVWEWTSSNYIGASLPQEFMPHSGLRLPSPLRSIRGGAFDTYFDTQAACQFQSGENPLNRRNNIGFRCAIGVCDLMLVRPAMEEAACSS